MVTTRMVSHHHKQGFDLLHSMILLYVYGSMILHRTGSSKTPSICLQYSRYVQLQRNLHENTLPLLIKQKNEKSVLYFAQPRKTPRP